MITAVDTNIIVALWDRDDALNSVAQDALDAAFARGALVASGAVLAELLAFPGRKEEFVNEFFRETGIAVDWTTNESIWRIAGRAFQVYAKRRRKEKVHGARRILADFIIGAHALEKGYTMLTLDKGIYRTAFPKLRVVSV
jgi:predicted nucleic acid-binding protein